MSNKNNVLDVKRRGGVLIVEPSHGLCNRLRVIRSALNFAQKFNLKLLVLWRVNEELGCRYDELFEIPSDFKVISFKGNIWGKFYCRIKRALSKTVITQANINNYKEENLIQLFNRESSKKTNIYIKTYDEFFTVAPQVGYDWLIPRKQLLKKVEEIVSLVGENGIGIHIRRTDNSTSIKTSPLELFIDKIQSDIQQDPKRLFYLATDDESVKNTLRERFGERIFTEKNILNRNSLKGMQDSVIDLFVLSKMSLIYGSHWSSFSEEAAKIGDIELQVMHI